MKEIKFLLIGLLFLSACKTATVPVKTVPIQYKERVVERLVPVEMPEDSSSVQALFECDSLNNVIMKELNEEKSKRAETEVVFADGVFQYRTIIKRDTVYLPAKDSIVYREVPVEVPVPYEVNKITKWQKIQMNAGRLLFLLVGLLSAYAIFRYKALIKKVIIGVFKRWLK